MSDIKIKETHLEWPVKSEYETKEYSSKDNCTGTYGNSFKITNNKSNEVKLMEKCQKDVNFLVDELWSFYCKGVDPYDFLISIFPFQNLFPNLSSSKKSVIHKLRFMLGYNRFYSKPENYNLMIDKIYKDPKYQREYLIRIRNEFQSYLDKEKLK
jgi:hypothetical protein